MNTDDAGKAAIDCALFIIEHSEKMEGNVHEIYKWEKKMQEIIEEDPFIGAYMFKGSEKSPYDPSFGCKYAKLAELSFRQINKYLYRLSAREPRALCEGECREKIEQLAELIEEFDD